MVASIRGETEGCGDDRNPLLWSGAVFLSSEQLRHLTGYKKPSLQRRWLVANGYRFDVRADGRPVVMVAQVEARQAGKSNVAHSEQPDFSVIGP